MAKRLWTEETAVACIKRNGGTIAGNGIAISNPGIKVLGAIDYLIHYHKYNRKRE